jgi:hypothetical protein
MNDHLFNKTQFAFFSKHLKADLGKVAVSKSCQWIVNVHRLGYIDKGYWFYSDKERAVIIDLMKSQLQIQSLTDDYPQKKSRIEVATDYNAEKVNALAVSEDFVLVNAFYSLNINSRTIPLEGVSCLGFYLNVKKIQSIEHQTLVLVENLSVMANLDKLVLQGEAEQLINALWIYRGDVKKEQNTSRAYAFFRRFKSTHRLVCFADTDPKGLEIALTSGATHFLSPSAGDLTGFSISGPDIDYFSQKSAVQYLTKQQDFLSKPSSALFNSMTELRKTIKQEHILAHAIPLQVFTLKDNVQS